MGLLDTIKKMLGMGGGEQPEQPTEQETGSVEQTETPESADETGMEEEKEKEEEIQ